MYAIYKNYINTSSFNLKKNKEIILDDCQYIYIYLIKKLINASK